MTKLLLVGAGHTHLHLITRADEFRAVGIHLTVLADPHFAYSGMGSAVAGGAVGPAANRIDVTALTARHGVDHVLGRAASLDLGTRTVTTAAGDTLATDLLSLNVGSDAATHDIDIGADVLAVKPLIGLAALPAMVDALPPVGEVAIVGGGASAAEIAANLAHRIGRPGVVQVWSRTMLPVPDVAPDVQSRIADHLDGLGVVWHGGVTVAAVGAGTVSTVGGQRGRADVAVLAAGLRPSRTIAALGLADHTGHLPTDEHLTHPDHDWVFGAGDAARFLPRPLPQIGVFGVRAGPVLAEVLLARAQGRPPTAFEPQEAFLAIFDLATTGVAMHGDRTVFSRPSLALKRLIDRRWLALYR